MADRYQNFANSGLGRTLVKKLGLPQPVRLERYDPSKPFVNGTTLLGAAPGGELGAAIARVLAAAHTPVAAADEPELRAAVRSGSLNVRTPDLGDAKEKFKALVFDASGIKNAQELKALYDFFNPVARKTANCARVIVLGRPPEEAADPKAATAQRALEGFVKSVGKEFKRGITAQLVYVSRGAENNIDSTLRFLLSPKSAYVSGQVIRVSPAAAQPANWTKPLAGKTALVTGASRGIGAAIAHTLARDGAHVICLDLAAQEKDLHKIAAQIGGSVLTEDITAPDAGEKIAAFAQSKGGLDIIVHNAGVTRDKMLANMKPEQWNMVLDINLCSQERINDILLAQGTLKPNGRIICVSSISGIAGNLGQSNYAASKAGVIGMVQALAPTLPDGITINAVAPGFIETAMTAAIPLQIREAGRRMNSLSQGGKPVDVAETIAWFANPASGGLNGNIVRVCGQSLLGA